MSDDLRNPWPAIMRLVFTHAVLSEARASIALAGHRAGAEECHEELRRLKSRAVRQQDFEQAARLRDRQLPYRAIYPDLAEEGVA